MNVSWNSLNHAEPLWTWSCVANETSPDYPFLPLDHLKLYWTGMIQRVDTGVNGHLPLQGVYDSLGGSPWEPDEPQLIQTARTGWDRAQEQIATCKAFD